jgi:hypothetical protein
LIDEPTVHISLVSDSPSRVGMEGSWHHRGSETAPLKFVFNYFSIGTYGSAIAGNPLYSYYVANKIPASNQP